MNKSPREHFLALIRASGLVDDVRLRGIVRDFDQQSDRSGSNTDQLEALKDFLIQNDFLTRWQSNKLSMGKWKGFILDDYVFLEQVGKGSESGFYSARDRRSGNVATLEVSKDASSPSGIRYEVKS